MTDVQIRQWKPGDPRWDELVALAETTGQAQWLHGDSLRSLVALEGDEPVGLLAYVVQEIGPENDCPPLAGLTEAKVRAFAVREDRRHRGIGTTLQQVLLDHARRAGCAQVRSQSDADNGANHRIKLRLGYAAHPQPREISGERRPGYYFVRRV